MEHIKPIEIPVDRAYRRIPIFAKQYDQNSRYFRATLTERGLPLNINNLGVVQKVAIGITLSNNQKKAYQGEYESSSGTFLLPFPGWALQNSGKVVCDVMIWGVNRNGNNGLLRSASFEVYVQPATDDFNIDDVIEDENS